MAQRYGLLPSQVLVKATTFDLEILDIAKSWERWRTNKTNGIHDDISTDVMQQAIAKVRK